MRKHADGGLVPCIVSMASLTFRQEQPIFMLHFKFRDRDKEKGYPFIRKCSIGKNEWAGSVWGPLIDMLRCTQWLKQFAVKKKTCERLGMVPLHAFGKAQNITNI